MLGFFGRVRVRFEYFFKLEFGVGSFIYLFNYLKFIKYFLYIGIGLVVRDLIENKIDMVFGFLRSLCFNFLV